MCYRCSEWHDLRQMGIGKHEGNNYSYLSFWTHENLQRGFCLKASLLSGRFLSWIWQELKKPHFSEKKKTCACPHSHPFSPFIGEATENERVLYPQRIAQVLLLSWKEKGTQWSQLHLAILLCPYGGKGGSRNYRPLSGPLSDNENVCLRGKYIMY